MSQPADPNDPTFVVATPGIRTQAERDAFFVLAKEAAYLWDANVFRQTHDERRGWLLIEGWPAPPAIEQPPRWDLAP